MLVELRDGLKKESVSKGQYLDSIGDTTYDTFMPNVGLMKRLITF